VKLAIGLIVSHGFPAPTDFWFSYERMKEHVRTGATNTLVPDHLKVSDLRVFQSTAFPVDVARNEICRNVLKEGYDYLFFADCDHLFQPDTIGQLLKHDKAVISGRYHMRKEPYHAVAYVKHRVMDGPHAYAPVHWGQGVFEIERGGGGCLLIRRDVLEAIDQRVGQNWFRYQRGPEFPHDYTVSEDFWFFQQAREAGFSCWLDWDVEAGHIQQFAINRSWNESYLDAQVRALPTMAPEERQKALDSFVVCGLPDGLRLPGGYEVTPYTYLPGER
jgi:hypothetical protein